MTLTPESEHADRWVSLRDHVDALREQQDKLLDERFATQTQAIATASAALSEVLSGFPQEYAKREDLERIRDDLVAIRSDHVQRREFEALRESVADDFEAVHKTAAEGSGKRTALTGVAAIIVTLLSLSVGLAYKNQVTEGTVNDKTAPLQEQINELSQQQIQQNAAIKALQVRLAAK